MYVRGSMSTRTGRAPVSEIVSAVAMKVCVVVITSSPGLTSQINSARWSAAVPLSVPTQCCAWQNAAKTLRRYNDKHCLIKIEWHVDDAGATDEFEYLKGVRFTNITREAPDGEVMERVEFIFSDWGHRPVS